MKTYKSVTDCLNKDDSFPYLSYEHPLAKILLFMQIKRYNRKAEKWGHKTRAIYDMQYHYGLPSPLIDPKSSPGAGFFKNFIHGYRNEYLDSLGCIIIDTSLRVKFPLWKRYWKFVYFWINYP